MVRGVSNPKCETTSTKMAATGSPSKKSKSKERFKGKLSHTSVINSNKISPVKCETMLNTSPTIVNVSPLKSKARRKFPGRITHSSSIYNNKITRYYNVQNVVQLQENKLTLESSPKSSIEKKVDILVFDDQKRKVLQEANERIEENRTTVEFKSEPETNKTESCVPFSPSTALSHFSFNSPKRVSKVRKRLIPENKVLTNNNKMNADVLKNNSNATNPQTKLTEFFPVRRSVRKTKKTVLEEKRKNLEEAILSNKEDGLEVRIFEGKGRGVIAARKFYKGEFVVEYVGELITMEEAQKREAVYARNENIGCYMYYFEYKNIKHCIDATVETDRLGRLVNHSRNGNLSTKTIEVNGTPHLILIAKEDIEPDSELTYDYGDRSKLSLQYHPWLAL